jgi:hypothetical protein
LDLNIAGKAHKPQPSNLSMVPCSPLGSRKRRNNPPIDKLKGTDVTLIEQLRFTENVVYARLRRLVWAHLYPAYREFSLSSVGIGYRCRACLNGPLALTDSAQPVTSLRLAASHYTPGLCPFRREVFTTLVGDSPRYSPIKRGRAEPSTGGCRCWQQGCCRQASRENPRRPPAVSWPTR